MEPNFKLIRFIRKQQGYTLKSLAKTTGIPYQRLSSLENGDIIPRQNYIEKIEEVLCIDFLNNTEEDQSILNLFDEFLNVLFYGNYNTETISKRVTTYYEESLNSKYYYLVYLMKYVFEVLDNNENLLDNHLLDDIVFDKRAFHIYLIYYGVHLYERKRVKQAEDSLIKVLVQTIDEKVHCLASYQLLFIYIRSHNLDEASRLVKKAKQTFFEFGAFIRAYECNLHQATIYAFQHRYDHAIKQYEICIESALSLELPKAEVNLIYRNIALAHIYNHSYDKALTYLEAAYLLDKRNENAIMYYLYIYYFTSDLENFNAWIKLAKKMIKSSSYLKELDFFTAISKKAFKPTQVAIDKALKVYKYYDNLGHYELVFFYLDILISLFEQINDEKNMLFYLKKQNKLLTHTQNS